MQRNGVIILTQLRELRKKNNLTLGQVAKEIGVSESCICLYEKGIRRPNIERLAKIAIILNCSIDEVVNAMQKNSKID